MALDKLVDSSQLDADLTSVANAIRTKGGTSAQLSFPQGFVDAVGAISSGGGTTPTGTKEISITANGTTTEDVAAYANAEITVNVPSGETDYVKMAYITRTYTGRLASDYAFQIPNNFFPYGKMNAIFLPNATTTSANSTAGTQAFGWCTSLKTAVIGQPHYLGQEMFRNDTALTAVDLGSTATRLVTALFSGCTKLNVLVIRRNGVCALLNTNVFDNTPFASGKAGGTLYVPQAQTAAYQAATNWSTILGYSTNSIQAIEGSPYENAYVDGTPIE